MKKLQEIDFTSLEQFVSNKVGFPIKFDVSIGTRRNGIPYINLISQELKNVAGIMAVTYETLRIETFNSSFTPDKSKYWLTLSFMWKYKDGGANGTEIARAIYDFETKTWDMQ